MSNNYLANTPLGLKALKLCRRLLHQETIWNPGVLHKIHIFVLVIRSLTLGQKLLPRGFSQGPCACTGRLRMGMRLRGLRLEFCVARSDAFLMKLVLSVAILLFSSSAFSVPHHVHRQKSVIPPLTFEYCVVDPFVTKKVFLFNTLS